MSKPSREAASTPAALVLIELHASGTYFTFTDKGAQRFA